MELKLRNENVPMLEYGGSNRTFMELKYQEYPRMPW